MEVNTEAEGRLAEAREALQNGVYGTYWLDGDQDLIPAFEEAVRASERASLQGQIDRLTRQVNAAALLANFPNPEGYVHAGALKIAIAPQPVPDGEEAEANG